jgi:hypothetical protein
MKFKPAMRRRKTAAADRSDSTAALPEAPISFFKPDARWREAMGWRK